MTISSLVITVDPERATELERTLACHPELELGAAVRNRLPAVLVTSDLRSSAEFAERLGETAGVLGVDVVRVDLVDDVESEGSAEG